LNGWEPPRPLTPSERAALWLWGLTLIAAALIPALAHGAPAPTVYSVRRGFDLVANQPYIDVLVSDDATSVVLAINPLNAPLVLSNLTQTTFVDLPGPRKASRVWMDSCWCANGPITNCNWWRCDPLHVAPLPTLPWYVVKATACVTETQNQHAVSACAPFLAEAAVTCTPGSGAGCPCKMFSTATASIQAGETCIPLPIVDPVP